MIQNEKGWILNASSAEMLIPKKNNERRKELN